MEHPKYYGLGVITNAHLFHQCTDDRTCKDIQGDPLYACPIEENQIGNVAEFDLAEDWAFVPKMFYTPVDGLSNEIISSSYSVNGHVTQNGLEYMRDANETVHKYGKTTCYESGTVTELDTQLGCAGTPCGKRVNVVRTSANSEPGDSGGPLYREHDSYGVTTIVGIHEGGGAGMPAYYLNSKYGIEFTNNSTC